MNLHISEIDNLEESHEEIDNNDEVEDVGYVDQHGQFFETTSRVPPPRITTMSHKNRGSLMQLPQQPQPRKVTYDDILSSLNMKVINGKLQIVRNIDVENIKTNNMPLQQAPGQRQPQSWERQQQPGQRQQEQMQQEQMQQQQRPPLTKEQYKQILVANYIKQARQQQHIRNVKSTRLMFPTSNINISSQVFNNNNNNRLFHLKGVGK
jgi:hypothetical protein